MDQEPNRPNQVLKPNHKSSPKPKSQPKKKKLVKKKVKKRIVKTNVAPKKAKRKEIIKDAINIHKSEYIPEYVDENHENFECAICTDIFKSPMVLNCGHIFCSKCIKKWKSQSNEASCPTCRKKIISLNNIPLIQNMIETLQIKCKFSPVGCEWQGQSSQLDEHIRFCPKNPKRCPHKGCNQVMFPPDMKKHVTKCRYRLVLCKFCEKTTQFQNQQKNHSLVECLLCGQKNASCLGNSHVCNYFEKSPPVQIEENIEINEKIEEKTIRTSDNNKVCNFCNKTFPIDFIFEHKTVCSKSNKDKNPSKEVMLKDNRKSISFHVSRNKPSYDGITKIDLINADKRLLMNFAEKKDNIFSNPLRLSDSGSSSTTESEEDGDEQVSLLKRKKKGESMKRTVSVRFHRNNFLHLKEIKESNSNEATSSPRSRNWIASSPNESVRRELPQDRMIIGRKSKNNNLNNSPNSNKLNIRGSNNNVNNNVGNVGNVNNNVNNDNLNVRNSNNIVNNVNNNVGNVNRSPKKKEQRLELGTGDFYCPHCRDLVVGTERVDHYNVCSAFPHPCIYCLYKYPRSFISEHMSQCPHNTKKSKENNNNNNNDKDDKDDKDSTVSNNNNLVEPAISPFDVFVQKFRNIFK